MIRAAVTLPKRSNATRTSWSLQQRGKGGAQGDDLKQWRNAGPAKEGHHEYISPDYAHRSGICSSIWRPGGVKTLVSHYPHMAPAAGHSSKHRLKAAQVCHSGTVAADAPYGYTPSEDPQPSHGDREDKPQRMPPDIHPRRGLDAGHGHPVGNYDHVKRRLGDMSLAHPPVIRSSSVGGQGEIEVDLHLVEFSMTMPQLKKAPQRPPGYWAQASEQEHCAGFSGTRPLCHGDGRSTTFPAIKQQQSSQQKKRYQPKAANAARIAFGIHHRQLYKV